jgi:hypothetical protein
MCEVYIGDIKISAAGRYQPRARHSGIVAGVEPGLVGQLVEDLCSTSSMSEANRLRSFWVFPTPPGKPEGAQPATDCSQAIDPGVASHVLG